MLQCLVPLLDNPIVGAVRGKGLLTGVEFVADKQTREPFPPERGVTAAVVDRVFDRGVLIMPGAPGLVDGVRGDHIAISPPFTVGEDEVETTVRAVTRSGGGDGAGAGPLRPARRQDVPKSLLVLLTFHELRRYVKSGRYVLVCGICGLAIPMTLALRGLQYGEDTSSTGTLAVESDDESGQLTESARVKRAADFSGILVQGFRKVAGGDLRDQPRGRCRNRRVAQRENLLPALRDSRLPLSRGSGAQSSDHHPCLRHCRRRAGERYPPAPVLVCRPSRSADLLQGPGMPRRRDDTLPRGCRGRSPRLVFTSGVPASVLRRCSNSLRLWGWAACTLHR